MSHLPEMHGPHSPKLYWRYFGTLELGDSLQSSASLGWRNLCQSHPHITVHVVVMHKVKCPYLQTKGCHSTHRTWLRGVGMTIWGTIPKVFGSFSQESEKRLSLARFRINPRHRHCYWAVSYPHRKIRLLREKPLPERKGEERSSKRLRSDFAQQVAIYPLMWLTISIKNHLCD